MTINTQPPLTVTTTSASFPNTASVAELESRIERLQRRLEAIYGPERVVEWLEEGTPLPEVRVDPIGTIRYRAQITGLSIARKKDAPSLVRIGLTSRLRSTPVKELGDLSEEAEMDIRISPRMVQQGLALSFGPAAPPDDELEASVSDETLEARLTALSSRTGALPEGWREWDQARKDTVARWAWAMMLSASDNEITIPSVPFDVEEWYWGPEAIAEQRAAGLRDTEADAWDDQAPPKLRDEDAEIIRNRMDAAGEQAPVNGTPASRGRRARRPKAERNGRS